MGVWARKSPAGSFLFPDFTQRARGDWFENDRDQFDGRSKAKIGLRRKGTATGLLPKRLAHPLLLVPGKRHALRKRCHG